MVINIPGYYFEHYVIEIPTGIDPLIEVRAYESISSTAKGPINLFRNLRPEVRKTAEGKPQLTFVHKPDVA